MSEYGVEESWTKQFVIDPSVVYDKLLLVDDKLILISDKYYCMTLELMKLRIFNLEIFQTRFFFLSQIITNVKSLVSVTGGNVFES